MLNTRLWISFAIWEAVAVIIALILVNEFTQGGGGFNHMLFLGVIIGSTGFWWSVLLMGKGLVGDRRRQ